MNPWSDSRRWRSLSKYLAWRFRAERFRSQASTLVLSVTYSIRRSPPPFALARREQCQAKKLGNSYDGGDILVARDGSELRHHILDTYTAGHTIVVITHPNDLQSAVASSPARPLPFSRDGQPLGRSKHGAHARVEVS